VTRGIYLRAIGFCLSTVAVGISPSEADCCCTTTIVGFKPFFYSVSSVVSPRNVLKKSNGEFKFYAHGCWSLPRSVCITPLKISCSHMNFIQFRHYLQENMYPTQGSQKRQILADFSYPKIRLYSVTDMGDRHMFAPHIIDLKP
jgi:hypothetical protein